MKKKITITSIARELGVSPATVSRALNDSPKISDLKRREIKEFARQNNFFLRNSTKRTTNLCVLVCTVSPNENVFSTHTGQIAAGANRYCNENDLELSVFSQTHDHLNTTDPVKELFHRGANGVVVIHAHDDSDFIGKFEEEKLPYCCLISGSSKYPDRILSIDNKTPAIQAINHLIHLGHRHIGFIYSDIHSPAHLERLDGYRTAMENENLEPIIINIIPGLAGTEMGFEAARELLAHHSQTTAIFTTSDELAIGARAALYNLRLRIPEDISIISCDGSTNTRYFSPALTVIDTPNEKLGYTAAAWVHAQIIDFDTPIPNREPWMESRLLLRESTAPPRK